jgi:uncharacterized membrane protein YjfL (UPF0719 family)
MSADELIVTAAAVILGPILWGVWLFRMSRVRAPRRGGAGPAAIAAALVGCAALLYVVLRTAASYDVVDAPRYQLMYVVVGLAWVRVAEMMFPYLGLSPRDDVVERSNKAAMLANIGALFAVTLCYAGANIGNGPGWWVVVFSGALSSAALMVAWAVLAQLTPVADAVTIDRDPAAGIRLGGFLVGCGLVLGRGVAGDWESATATLSDFAAALPPAAAILILAIVVERLARPTPQRPHAPLLAWGVLPAVLYLVVAINAVKIMGWPA